MRNTQIDTKIRRLLRFAKDHAFYNLILLKYKSIDDLNLQLYKYPIKDYFLNLIEFICQKGDILLSDLDIMILNEEWKKYVKDLIIIEEKEQKIQTELIKALHKIKEYNCYSVYEKNIQYNILDYISCLKNQ